MTTTNSTTSSTTAYSYLQYKNKIGGLVSGMDIDSIMEKLMKAESSQMEKLQQQKQKYEWKRDAYREVNTKLNTYQQSLFDKYALKSSWNSKTASVSNNSSASVKVGTSASGNLTISEIKTAKAAQTKFDSTKVTTEKMTGSATLADINVNTNYTLFSSGSNSVAMNGNTTIDNIMSSLNDNGYTTTLTNGQLKVTATDRAVAIDEDTQKGLEALGFSFSKTAQQSTVLKDGETNATKTTKLSNLNLTSGTISIKDKDGIEKSSIDLTQFASDTEATVNDLLKKIQDEGYNASITNGRISISSKDANTEINVDISAAGSNVEFSSAFASNISNAYVVDSTNSQGTTLKSSNTIQDLMGGESWEIGMVTLSVLQADGKMKDTEISYKATDTIDSLMTKINSSGAGVTALFNDGQFSLSANNTGDNESGAEISLVTSLSSEKAAKMTEAEKLDWNTKNEAGTKLFSKLTGQGQTLSTTELVNNGNNASMTINGVEYKQSSNVFNVAGYEITATSDLTTASAPITVASSVDVDKTIDKVKEFVTMYNDLIAEINKKTTEKRNVDYSPLTDAQKAEMTESQIEKWEEKAKAGLLKGDTTLTNVLSKMRQTLFNYGTSSIASNSKEGTTAVGIKGETLASIGIATSKTWSDNGKLEIDEDKLRAALEKDPDIVSRIFTGDGTKENPGVVSQLRTTAQEAVKTIEKSAGKDTSASETSYSIGKTINSLSTKIDDWKDRLKDIEERYWKQFSAMETAIQKANSQSSMFMQ